MHKELESLSSKRKKNFKNVLVVCRDTLTYVRTKRVLTIDESGNHTRHQAKLQRALDSEVRLGLNWDLLWAA